MKQVQILNDTFSKLAEHFEYKEKCACGKDDVSHGGMCFLCRDKYDQDQMEKLEEREVKSSRNEDY